MTVTMLRGLSLISAMVPYNYRGQGYLLDCAISDKPKPGGREDRIHKVYIYAESISQWTHTAAPVWAALCCHGKMWCENTHHPSVQSEYFQPDKPHKYYLILFGYWFNIFPIPIVVDMRPLRHLFPVRVILRKWKGISWGLKSCHGTIWAKYDYT